jgi:hypothetical protein
VKRSWWQGKRHVWKSRHRLIEECTVCWQIRGETGETATCPGPSRKRKEKPMRYHTWVMKDASTATCENCGMEITSMDVGLPVGPCEPKEVWPEMPTFFPPGEKDPLLEKPPLGLRPLAVVVDARIQEILAACTRYAEAGKAIPEEWITELDRLNKARSLK